MIVVSLQNLWSGAIGVIGNILGAVVVMILGVIVASGIGAVIESVVRVVKLDNLLKKIGVEEHLDRAGLELDAPKFFGKLAYWFLVVAFLLAASDILGFYTLSEFLKQVLLYVPNIIVAILIMLATVVIAHFLRGLVKSSVQGARLHASNFLASLTWWTVVIFGFFASLSQLGVAENIINALVTGLVAMLAIAGGLAFGLGGKDAAADFIRKLRERIRD